MVDDGDSERITAAPIAMLFCPMTPMIVTVAAFAPAAGSDPAADETRDLFERAATQYETSQYNGAVETYTQAYQRSLTIEDEELRGRVQAAIFFNLARAHVKAYALDKSAEHLQQAIDLLDKYLAQTADLADQLDAEQLLDEARTELDRVEDQQREDARANEPSPAEVVNKPGLKIAGYTLLGLGIAAGGAGIAGAVLAADAQDQYLAGPTRDDRDQAQDQGSIANTMIIAGSVSAGVLVGVGVTLVLVDRKRSRSRVSPTAWATPTSVGVAVGGRF